MSHMLFNKIALTACFLLLLSTLAAARSAARRGDKQRTRVLHFFRLGLCLSAFSYIFRVMGAPPTSAGGVLSFVCCFAGTLLIWIGWMEHGSLSRVRAGMPPAVPNEENSDEAAAEPLFSNGGGLPALNKQAYLALRHAQDEAVRSRQRCVDTDHLLLGLLRQPGSAGAHILDRLAVKWENIFLALGHPEGNEGSSHTPPPPAARRDENFLPLTGRAREALVLAGYEAHRFDKAAVGTDHLLLGLALMGTGAAAAALFREGVTVDSIRGEVLKSRQHG